jgi:probable phosphoglycerate mutase
VDVDERAPPAILDGLMELLFVRHAQPEWVRDGKSVLNPVLTEVGRRQAEHLGTRASSWEDVDEVWMSPTARTRETAAPLAEALGAEPVVYDWLEEIRLPSEWDGQDVEVMGPLFAAARERTVDQWDDGLLGGERFADFFSRVTRGLDEALAAHGARSVEGDPRTRVFDVDDAKKRIVIVGHGGTNSVAVTHLLGLPAVPWSWERFVLSHASVTRLRSKRLIGARIFGLRELSDTRHLPEPLVTR